MKLQLRWVFSEEDEVPEREQVIWQQEEDVASPSPFAQLLVWWVATAVSDLVKTAPKTSEYGGVNDGSADLRVMGYALAELCGMHDADEAVKYELAVWFYALGKISRLISDYKHGKEGKADTWFDLSVYSMMARRIQEVGRWP